MTGAAADWHGTAPLALLLIALAADGLVGSAPAVGALLGVPLSFIRGLTRWFDGRLNRSRRGVAALRMRGALVVVVLVLLAWAAGALLDYFIRHLPHGWMVEALAVVTLLRQRDAIACARRTVHALAAGDQNVARAAVRPLVRYDAATLDEFGVARAAIEGSVVRFAEGYVGGVFWYLLLGLPALCIYRTVTAAADAIGRPSPRHAAFGFTASRLADVLALAPAIIAGPLLACAALFVPRARPASALAGWARDLAARGARAAFRAEGAMAGALDVALGGPRPFDGATRPGSWIGEGRARATVTDVRRAVLLITVACLLVALLLALALVARGR